MSRRICETLVVAIATPYGAVAQLVAHLHGMEGVRGSNPLSSTTDKSRLMPALRRLVAGVLGWIREVERGTSHDGVRQLHKRTST